MRFYPMSIRHLSFLQQSNLNETMFISKRIYLKNILIEKKLKKFTKKKKNLSSMKKNAFLKKKLMIVNL